MTDFVIPAAKPIPSEVSDGQVLNANDPARTQTVVRQGEAQPKQETAPIDERIIRAQDFRQMNVRSVRQCSFKRWTEASCT
jgi:hypothetical protein